MEFKEFGKIAKEIRKNKKISQQELSVDLNISRATISSFENGSSVDMGFKKVLQIFDYLGYSITIKETSDFPVFEELLGE